MNMRQIRAVGLGDTEVFSERLFLSGFTKSKGGNRASQVVLVVKNTPGNAGDLRCGFNPWVGKIPWRRTWQPTLVFFPGESHGQRSLAGYSPWGRKESDMTEAT